jgi:uncharacterized protein
MHRNLLVSTALLLLLSAIAEAQPPARDGRATEPVIVASGSAIVRRAPDRAFLVLATELRAPGPAEAQQKAAQAMVSVRERLKAAGIADEAIKTLSYTLREEFEYANNRRTSRGYVAANTIEVRIDDIERVGKLLDAAVQSGATTVSDIRFDLKNRDAAEREALRLAVADARGRAEAVAAGAGRSLGAILRIEEQGAVQLPPRPMGMMAARAEAVADTPITPGEIEVRASVTLTAALQ